MTVREALTKGANLLKDSETPFLDAGLLLASVMNISRDKLLASYPESISIETYHTFMELIQRRSKGIPVSYLLNRKEFYGRIFYVDERVLVPRPDTEILVGTALRVIDNLRQKESENPVKFLDICTGTGCVPITVALELMEHPDSDKPGKQLKEVEITAGELSGEAMEVFRINQENLGSPRINLVKSDLLTEIEGEFDIITANPPYIPSSETGRMMDSGWPEPTMALDGGEDGLDLIRKLIPQSMEKLKSGGYLIMEAGFNQLDKIRTIMETAGFEDTEIIRDLAGRNRVIKGKKSV